MKISNNVSSMKESPSVLAAELARQLKAEGKTIFDFTIGQPDFDTPDNIKKAAISAIEAGETKYTPVNGLPVLRDAIRQAFQRKYDIEVTDRHITVGGGGKQVIFAALMATLNAGDEVIIPTPYWVSYPDMVHVNNGTPVIIETSEAQRFKVTAAQLEQSITPRTRWVILNIPSNPTGMVYDEKELGALAEVLRKHPDILVMIDAIYDGIWFKEGPLPSLLSVAPELKDQIFFVDGVSKRYAMTGWRLGYGIGPEPLIKAINKLQSQMASCPSSISQHAAAAALNGVDDDFVDKSVAVYRQRRDLACQKINTITGLSCLTPDGAFYIYVNCQALMGKRTPGGGVIESDFDVVRYLLEQAGVATIQGEAYGLSPYFRMSFATSTEVIEEGCDRIARAVKALTD
ncbi:aspartate transaminase [Halomonas sp.]|uniref:aspartate transaminase n=1 Tax=Halomonas sp. TaxID=1486246 RepID=UPI003A928F8F